MVAYKHVILRVRAKTRWPTIRLARNIKSKSKDTWLTIWLARNIKSKNKDSVAYNQASTQY